MGNRRSRKQQTRLAFEPLNAGTTTTTSSSTPSSTPQPVFTPALVRYRTGNGQVRQRFNLDWEANFGEYLPAADEPARDGDSLQEKLATPKRSSPRVGRLAGKSSSVGRSTITPRRSELAQPSSSHVRGSQSTSAGFINRHKHTFESPFQNPKRRKKQATVIVSDDSSSDPGEERSVNAEDADESDTSSAASVTVTKVQTTSARSSRRSAAGSKRKADDLEDSDVPTPCRRQRRRVIEDDDSGESVEELPAQAPASKRAKRMPKEGIEIVSSDSEDDVVLSPRKRSTKGAIDSDSDSDESIVLVSSARKKQQDVNDESSSADDIITSSVRKTRTAPRKSSPTAQSGSSDESARKSRRQPTKRPKRTAKQKQMELLRRKRAGEDIDELTPSEDDDEPRTALYDSDEELQALKVFDDEEDDSADQPTLVEPPVREPHKSSPKNEDEYESDFVVEDDDVPLGVPMPSIPLEFTHQAHKPLKSHFKDAVEWMVQNQINPRFARDDDIYTTAFRKLNDEVRGRANSTFASAAWSASFTRTLYARPLFFETALGIAEVGWRKCDACGRSGHPAKFVVQLAGKAYHRDSLEEVDGGAGGGDDDDDDDDEHSDAASINSRGEALAPQATEWYLGRFCKANAETAHALVHWKFALNGWVVDQLAADGWMAPERVVERDGLRRKARTALANRIVDDWEADGQVKALWRDFKKNLEIARQGRQQGKFASQLD